MMGMSKREVRFAGSLAAVLAVSAFGYLAAEEGGAGGKYVGAAKCKNCHRSEKAGNAFGKWQKMEHAKAFETLGGAEAKEAGKKAGVDDPQKSEKCLKCHVTAYGVAADQLSKKFDPKMGVQCESCHGAGEKHVKDRLAAAGGDEDAGDAEKAYVKIPDGEIVIEPTVDACLKCHNKESPTYKPICITNIAREILHLDPRKKRSDADVEALKKKIADALDAKGAGCGGPEKCGKCKKAAGK
jgi:hypothetical protein